jgi:hypothetical protein
LKTPFQSVDSNSRRQKIMKKFVLLTILLSATIGFAQKKPQTVVTVKPHPVLSPVATAFSEAEWKILTDAFQSEDWTKAAAIAAQYLSKLKSDNDKKQLAQLRYLRLYALAGKILAVSGANIPADNDALWKELDDAASEFNGREFVLPPRRHLSKCVRVANYICRVADNDRALRVTATNKAGTAIHSFDYIVFDAKSLPDNLPESELFLGGTLKRVEYNQDLSKPWVMRLIFEKGFVNVVSAITK